MFEIWDPEVFAREAEVKVRELRDEYRRAKELCPALRRRVSRVAARAAFALWRLSERLGKEAEHGRGLAGASDA